ncbi:MAG: hypothetical protein AB1896_22295 [Thermodesulfobacteriota bacterium]
MLSGKKTYIVGVATILSGIAGMVINGQVDQAGINAILLGLGMLTGRAAIAKLGK